MSIRTAALHTVAELAFVGCDDASGIATYTAASASVPGKVNTVDYDTVTGDCHCDCRGAEFGRTCWHMDLAPRAWAQSPAVAGVRRLTDARLVAYGTRTAALVAAYRARIGRALPMDATNLLAARWEWRRRAALAFPVAEAA